MFNFKKGTFFGNKRLSPFGKKTTGFSGGGKSGSRSVGSGTFRMTLESMERGVGKTSSCSHGDGSGSGFGRGFNPTSVPVYQSGMGNSNNSTLEPGTSGNGTGKKARRLTRQQEVAKKLGTLKHKVNIELKDNEVVWNRRKKRLESGRITDSKEYAKNLFGVVSQRGKLRKAVGITSAVGLERIFTKKDAGHRRDLMNYNRKAKSLKDGDFGRRSSQAGTKQMKDDFGFLSKSVGK